MKIPLTKPILTDEMIQAVVEALRKDRFLNGEIGKKFEEEFARFIGVNYAIAVNSGTSALHLSLIALGIKEGDVVITTPATFIATANVILYLNAKPVFTDISLETYNIDPQRLRAVVKKHGPRCKAVIPVHLFGYPCEMEAIMEVAEKYDIEILEDACQAHGAIYKGRRVGSFGNAAGFSFYPSKNMTVCGDGGMITTNDSEIAEILSSLRDVGRSTTSRYVHQYVGYTARMNTINAAIGRIQLKHLDEWNKRRREIAREYDEKLNGIGDIITPPKETDAIKPVYHLYVIRTMYRDALKNYLEKKGIECGIHYPLPVHLQPPYKRLGFHKGMFPNAEKLAKEALSLPMFPDLTKEEIEYIVSCVEDFFKKVKH
jgi:dTDP-4-amino-4,6-dideoxygalactose transaminase